MGGAHEQRDVEHLVMQHILAMDHPAAGCVCGEYTLYVSTEHQQEQRMWYVEEYSTLYHLYTEYMVSSHPLRTALRYWHEVATHPAGTECVL